MGKKMKTMDGNSAAAYVSYAFTDVAAIYPITPSSPMAEAVDEMAAHGRKNLFGQEVKVVEMQSEAGAAGALHGALASGALASTYTGSQGLLLMIPNMYKIAGELLPGVFHVTARSVASHALCIFGDHSDVMAARQTGFAMLCSGSVQEVMDLSCVAHLCAIEGRVPFLHFFDGFRTSHEIQKIQVIDYDDMEKMLNREAVEAFRARALNPEHPVIRGTAQNPDIFFQAREASQPFYDRLPSIVADAMDRVAEATGRDYHLFDYVGASDAKYVIIAMGSVCETIEETMEVLLQRGEKVGLVKVRLYRPWSPRYLQAVIPSTAQRLAVLDRTKESGASDDPLCMDVRAMYCGQEGAPEIYGGRYGLGSKDTTPEQILAVFENLKADHPRDHFTIGIEDDVTHTSLAPRQICAEPEGTIRCKFWGLGSDGTVGANKQAIKIIGDHTDLYAQGYFSYDSKKSGGLTVSHLRFGTHPIRSAYLITEADFIACHNQAYVDQYDLWKGLVRGGTFLLNCSWSEEELGERLPAEMKRYLAEREAKLYLIDAVGIAQEIGLGNRINMIMQAAFFRLAEVMPLAEAVELLKESIQRTYGKKGDRIVAMNQEAVERGISGLKQVKMPSEWSEVQRRSSDDGRVDRQLPAFISQTVLPMLRQEGDSLPVSTFCGREDGTFPPGTAAYEKRGVAVNLPQWQPDRCIQCNRCSLVCPHATIRPFLLKEEELGRAPKEFVTIPAGGGKALAPYGYRIQVSPMDCLGCGSCADVCPAPQKALIMRPFTTQEEENWDFAMTLPVRSDLVDRTTVKGSQFCRPYLEFSGACAGCGETPYIKAVTQLYGDRMMIANATGCSSIWGASAPSMPYTVDEEGRGPAWANSLFEDNAEYGLGMAVGIRQMREKICREMEVLLSQDAAEDVKEACRCWIEGRDAGEESRGRADRVVAVLERAQLCGEAQRAAREILKKKEFLVKKSVWCVGGDGWAYDIGYGGLDHVLASGEDINLLVFDTEVYSNTGGQASKATPAAAVAKFAAAGKEIKKKDLGMMAMSYGYVYVAQVGMGADPAQCMKAIAQAESYPGPSLILCYAPCINHGLKKGMGKAQENIREAVECGYWHLYRYDPLRRNGNNPFTLDSKEPSGDFRQFLLGQVRYSALAREFPQRAEALYAKTEADAKERWERYRRLAEER